MKRAPLQTSGEATHYELGSTTGNCSYPAAPADQLYVALPPDAYASAAACGSYLHVTGPDGSVTVEVVDQCPDCGPGHIDLSAQAFARIAPLVAGLVPVTYQTIADPPLPAPLALRVKEGSNPYWLALLPIGTGNPVASLQVRTSAGGWQDLSHTSYNYWLAASGMGPGPFTVRVTDTAGHQVTAHGITLSPGVIQPAGSWMYGAGTVPATPSPTPRPQVPPSDRPTDRLAAAIRVLAAAAHRWRHLLPAAGPRPAAPPDPAPSC